MAKGSNGKVKKGSSNIRKKGWNSLKNERVSDILESEAEEGSKS